MTHFKNNHGFTLIETMIATAVLGILMTPLFMTESSIFLNVSTVSRLLARVLVAQNFFVDSRIAAGKKQEFVLEKKIDEPLMQLKYEVTAIDKKSKLSDFDNLMIERVTIEWNEGTKKQKEILISYIFKPKEQKKTA
jgi:prepilin-type N-terminal cleavage/methylation domain-containing protein